MGDALQHRGPDGEGIFINEKNNTALAHRRLSIIDLSSAAAQPMQYLHYRIMLNGEIYNYRELRDELIKKGYSFTTQSDTEIIPAAYDAWGIDCLQKFDGMFVIVLFDEKNESMLIARDRFGEKPLYYYAEYIHRGRFEYFIFGSEIKALKAFGLSCKLNGTALLNYLGPGYLQNPQKKTQTFFSNVLSLPPSHYLTIQPGAGTMQMKRWYAPDQKFSKAEGKEDDIIQSFKNLFITSAERRLRSDVNIGTSLSGGVDSTSVLAAIHACREKNVLPVQWTNLAFTAGFPGFAKDETEWSRKAASFFNVKQCMITPTADDLISHWKQFMHHQEEPVQSSSAFIQFMVYKLAKENNVTVLLDGQGADEILAGYTKYMHWYLQQLVAAKNFNLFKKELMQLKANKFINEDWQMANYAAAMFPVSAAAKLQKKAFNQAVNHPYIQKEFAAAYSNFDSLQKPVVKQLEDMLYYNTFNLGLEELLRYADRNSMAHSAEVRLPFLYHELVEFIFSLPSSYKIKNGFTKWILRKAMQDMAPAELLWRKGKTGYEPPQQQWMMHGGMKEMIMESRKKLVKEKVLNENVMQAPLSASAAHDSDNNDWRYMCTAAMFAE